MGLLRFLLAMMVVFSHLHINSSLLGDSRFAVQMFFIISGFYISMVWSEKYNLLENPIRKFYLSRALRIYPLYFISLTISVLIAWYGLNSGHISALMALLAYPLSDFANIPVCLPQLTLFGMDIYPFFARLDDGSLEIAQSLVSYPRPYLFEYFFVPQAWSLSLELTFYLIAPLIIENTRTLIAIFLFSLGFRIMLWHFGFNFDPWTTRAFPLEIALFTGGALSQRVLPKPLKFLNKTAEENRFCILIGLTPILLTLFIKPIINYFGEFGYWSSYALTLASIPFLFHKTKSWKFDRALGDLSYPIYVSHWFAIGIFFVMDQQMDKIYPLVILTIILISILLNTIQRKIDILRNDLSKT